MTHLNFTLLGNRCLTKNDTIRGMSGRRNQHHPVSIYWRFAGYYFAPALAGLWKTFSITIAVPGVVIQMIVFMSTVLGTPRFPLAARNHKFHGQAVFLPKLASPEARY